MKTTLLMWFESISWFKDVLIQWTSVHLKTEDVHQWGTVLWVLPVHWAAHHQRKPAADTRVHWAWCALLTYANKQSPAQLYFLKHQGGRLVTLSRGSWKASSLKLKIYPKSYILSSTVSIIKCQTQFMGACPAQILWSWCEIKYFLRLFDPREEHQGAEDSFGASDIYIFM